MSGFSIGAVNSVTLPEEDQLELLYDAMANGQLDAVRNLFARVSVPAGARGTVIERAGWLSPPDLLSWLLDHDSYKLSLGRDAYGHYTNRALHAAIEGENLPNIKLLLSRGANLMSTYRLERHVEGLSWRLFSGILRALRRWNGTLMKFLVEDCGATIPPTWDDSNCDPSAIFEATHLSDATLEDVRHRFGAIKPYIPWPETYKLSTYYAVLARSPALVRISLENGGDPNRCPDPVSRSPLLECVEEPGQVLEIAELLLEFKADPNRVCRVYGKMRYPLQTIVLSAPRFSSTRMDCAKLLLRHGADPNVGDPISNLIYKAVKAGRSEIVKLLLQHGADPSQRGSRKIDGLAGMKRVEKYFGMPWHDIVRRIQAGEVVERTGSG
jgi:ankyrin repeat protein